MLGYHFYLKKMHAYLTRKMFYCYKKSIKIRNTHIQRFNFYIYIDFLNLSMNFHVSPMYIITMLFNYSCLANRCGCQKKIVQRKYFLLPLEKGFWENQNNLKSTCKYLYIKTTKNNKWLKKERNSRFRVASFQNTR